MRDGPASVVRFAAPFLVPFLALAGSMGCAAETVSPSPAEETGSQSSEYRVNPPDSPLGYHGGTGGHPDWGISCGAGNIATAIFGTYSSYIDQFGLDCARVNEDGSLTPIAPTGWVGGTAGTWFRSACPDNQAIVGLYGRSHTYLDQIGQILCAPISGLTGAYLNFELNHYFGSTAGGNGGDFYLDECPVNYAVTYFFVRAGSWIDAIQGHCQYVNPNQ